MRNRPRLSIVVPCYNEQEVLPETIGRLKALLQSLRDAQEIAADSRVVFVDDGSADGTWKLIREAHTWDASLGGIKLSANRGHQAAMIAGLYAAEGDAVVTVDADLQDDISVIATMVAHYRQGSDVVYGVRKSRETDTFFKRQSAEMYYRLLRFFGVRIVFNHADFRLMSRRAVESFKEYSEVNVFVRGIVPLLGYRSSVVYYARAERFAGESKYPLRKMLALAFDGITSFTAAPLRFISGLGVAISLMSGGAALWVLWARFFTSRAIPGWASSVLPVYFLGGLQLLSIGVLGEYVAKLYSEVKRRPRYFVEEVLQADAIDQPVDAVPQGIATATPMAPARALQSDASGARVRLPQGY